ncbi:unnamed protein product [Rotaria magnacalcarata]|uniref:Uncharacterized protein n=1 Tax=Rotaria magnacalcarata TaxID=392030 RepID=A0A815ZJ31_9BILA|nr:unnamed protein product [Rotaria magnacalcarata]CAF1585819.1 unnamed protein product [Rotaria magnacalcarata]CAF1916673.1 unnamed protein product [Rotaria magnacalcarata]CAF1928623.1 unnamed protein product [Rotaria magnacalcarata]CAF3842562.1 unnamed protein product [Rotaria magnacalcarata]
MNSILKLFFRQTENLLSLTKISITIRQLQYDLSQDNTNLFETEEDRYQCKFSYDLCNELRLLQNNLHSTCFLLQRALYRVHALRQMRGESSIQINDNLVIQYKENLSTELEDIQEKISSIINKHILTDSSLKSLQTLFKQIQENFEIFLNYTYEMPIHKSAIYLGNLVSNTLNRFYLILGSLARLIMDIEQFEMK